MTTEVIEIFEDHEVTSSALDINIGHGLKEAMRIRPEVFRPGDIVDIVARVQIKRVAHEPANYDSKNKEFDFDGPYTRIHVGIPLAVAPVTDDSAGAKAVKKMLDNWTVAVAKHRELNGQGSLLDDENDEALADKEERLAAEENAAKAAEAKASTKRGGRAKPAAAKDDDWGDEG